MENNSTKTSKQKSDTPTGAINLTEVASSMKSATPCMLPEAFAASENTQMTMNRNRCRVYLPHMILSPHSVMGIRDWQPEPEPVKVNTDLMTEEDITEFLLRLNDDLRRLEMVTMSSEKIETITMYLKARKYTFTEASVATMFILFGKKTDYTARGAVKPEYFWPQPEDMAAFDKAFVTREDFEATMGELKRQIAAEKTRLTAEIQKKDKLCATLQFELQRVAGKRAKPEELSAAERSSIELSKKLVDAACRAVDAEAKCKRLEHELALAERRIARFESLYVEYELVDGEETHLLSA